MRMPPSVMMISLMRRRAFLRGRGLMVLFMIFVLEREERAPNVLWVVQVRVCEFFYYGNCIESANLSEESDKFSSLLFSSPFLFLHVPRGRNIIHKMISKVTEVWHLCSFRFRFLILKEGQNLVKSSTEIPNHRDEKRKETSLGLHFAELDFRVGVGGNFDVLCLWVVRDLCEEG